MDRSTLHGKIMAGYQGWFNTPADGTGCGWRHYAKGHAAELTPDTAKFDVWPDTAEMDEDELCETGILYADDTPAKLPSSCNPKTVSRHFRWMKEYGLDGVFVQRFYPYCKHREEMKHTLRVLEYCRQGAADHDRAYGLMYDLSGMYGPDAQTVIDDFEQLVNDTGLTDDRAYIRHNGKPVVVVWGIGLLGRAHYHWSDCMPLVKHLKDWGATVMFGVPTGWREQHYEHVYHPDDPTSSVLRWYDAIRDPKMLDAFEMADIISPWSVARIDSILGASMLAWDVWAKDMDWCNERGIEYMPVVFPGFNWENMKPHHPCKHIARRKGALLWKQYYEAIRLGAPMIYQAMFDEVDEATAIFKCSNTPPGEAGLFIDMEGVPPDHYLKLVGEAGRMLRGDAPLLEQCPLLENGGYVGHA